MKPCVCALVIGVAAAVPRLASADVRAAAGVWQYELAGTVRDRRRTYDFNQDLELEASGRRSVLVEWDTGPGLWPDLAASFTRIGAEGDHEETFTLRFGGLPIASDTRTIVTTGHFDDAELTLRYPLALGAVSVSSGVAIKRLRGDLRIDDSEESAPVTQRYDEIVPLLHAQLRWPAQPWLALVASGQGITYQGSSAREWRAVAETRLRWFLIEAGWQSKRYDLSIERYALDARLDGWLLRVGAAW